MALAYGIALLLSGGGLWSVLGLVVRGRVAVALERQRRVSAIEVLERLPPGGRILEADGSGMRLIVVPGPQREPDG